MSAADALVARTVRGVWGSLPALLVASVAVCAAAAAALLVAPGVTGWAVLAFVVVGTPTVVALARALTTVAAGGDATVREWAVALRTHAGLAVRCGAVAAVPAELLLAALAVRSAHPIPMLLPSVALTAAATLVALPTALAALTLGSARPDLRGRVLWLTALHLVARRPTRFAAALVVPVAGVWAAVAWTASLLLLVPVPATLVLVIAVWTTADEVLDADAPEPATTEETAAIPATAPRQ